MPLRRATGFAVLTVLLSCIATLLVGFSQPASAVERELTTSYRCTSSQGSGRSEVTIKVNLPRRIQVGDRLAARTITFEINVPEAMVDMLRQYHADSVEGSSDDAYYRLRKKHKAINDLVLPETDVPASGGMTLVGTGTATGHTFQATGRYPVKVPVSFTAQATAHGVDIVGDVTVDLSCTLVADAPQRIATIRVVS